MGVFVVRVFFAANSVLVIPFHIGFAAVGGARHLFSSGGTRAANGVMEPEL